MGRAPSDNPSVSWSGEKRSASPRITSSSCVARSSPATTIAPMCSCDRRARRTPAIAQITETATTESHGDSRRLATPSAVPR